MTGRECQRLNGIVVDERICGDTIFKVEKLDSKFLVSDIFIYNSNCVFMGSSFQQRYEWTKDLLRLFIASPEIVHKSNHKFTEISHCEVYTDTEGFRQEVGESVRIRKTAIPDCYEVTDGGYLSVPTLEMSTYLKSLGEEFVLRCSKGDEDFWTVLENNPCVK